ncbi:hypothetical protein I4U23_007060 [Adineta vaga]|nr:hypothetical protein I4U23_007060 [Adineta vaga]
MKVALFISFFLVSVLIIIIYQITSFRAIILPKILSKSNVFIRKLRRCSNQIPNKQITFERRLFCKHKTEKMCYSTNKSLVVTFWQESSKDKWISQNILTAFPLHSFEHIIFIHDNSAWHTHPGYKHFMWIHIDGQHRFWYLKRFILPNSIESYQYLWIIDDDARLEFQPLNYQCVVNKLQIELSAPGRLSGALSHTFTKTDIRYINKTGRWTDFIETGPVVMASSLAWRCIHTFIDASAVTGWGIDLIWCSLISEHCIPKTKPREVCAILDAFGVHHQSTMIQSGTDGHEEISIYRKTYGKWFAKKRNIGPLTEDNRLFRSCSS